jgi:uroporphyrin-III C-methyltransferase
VTGKGEVYLVGAGPGDEELITVKGLRLIRTAEVLIFDALVSRALIEEADAAALRIDVGKRGRDHKFEQDGINQLIVSHAKAGKKVVRLKGGDPFMFGRGGEEVEELRKAGITVHVVPGVTSAIAAPALAGIPVTHRDHASFVTFVTGHESDEKNDEIIDWPGLAKLGGTIVVLMGMGNLALIMARLKGGGLDPTTPVAVVYQGSTQDQRVVMGTLDNIATRCQEEGVGAPSVIVVGSVAGLHPILGDLR